MLIWNIHLLKTGGRKAFSLIEELWPDWKQWKWNQAYILYHTSLFIYLHVYYTMNHYWLSGRYFFSQLTVTSYAHELHSGVAETQYGTVYRIHHAHGTNRKTKSKSIHSIQSTHCTDHINIDILFRVMIPWCRNHNCISDVFVAAYLSDVCRRCLHLSLQLISANSKHNIPLWT